MLVGGLGQPVSKPLVCVHRMIVPGDLRVAEDVWYLPASPPTAGIRSIRFREEAFDDFRTA